VRGKRRIDRRHEPRYLTDMAIVAIRLIRECLTLIAIFAVTLGPLGLSVSRGLGAQERVAVAAGTSQLPICAPGDAGDGLPAKMMGCDLCLPTLAAPPAASCAMTVDVAVRAAPADTSPSALLAQLRLPPSTGPPSA